LTRALLIRVWMAGSRKAIVFPVPVFACTKQSFRCTRSSWSVAAWTGIIWSNLRSTVMALRIAGWMSFSFSRSANRGVSRGIGAVRGGVATRGGDAGGGTLGVATLSEIFSLRPLWEANLFGFLFVSSIRKEARFLKDGERLKARESMGKSAKRLLAVKIRFLRDAEKCSHR